MDEWMNSEIGAKFRQYAELSLSLQTKGAFTLVRVRVRVPAYGFQ